MTRSSILCVALLVACGGKPPPPPVTIRNVTGPASPTGPRQPQRVEFGHLDADGMLHPQTKFELVSGMTYTWRIQLPCTGPVHYREVLVESGPTTWSVGADTVISADKTTATTTTFGACVDGWISHDWGVNENDPPGEYVITVEIEGYAKQTFRGTFSAFQPASP